MQLRKNILSRTLVAVIALATTRSVHAASIMDELNDQQKATVQNGQQVFVTQKVDGAPWPRMFIYQTIDSTPEEAAAVSIDYELRTTYTPDLKQAHIASHPDAATAIVDYLLHIPVLSDEHFELWQHVSTYDQGASYRLDFHLLKADRTKTAEGYTRIETLGTRTVMAVISFTDPNMFGAFIKQVEDERTQNPTKLQNQVQALRSSLGQ